MPIQAALNPWILVKFVMWLVVVAVGTVLLRRRRVTFRVRITFLVGGVVVFGFLFGLLTPQNPNPVASIRTLLTAVLVQHQFLLPIAAMLVILLLTVGISNKSICGWGCQLGLLQDLLHRVPLPKWNPPLWLSNGIRIVAFVALVGGIAAAGLDWIGLVDPFQLFQFHLTVWIVLFSAVLLAVSLFIYRPWCRFLCPFGLLSWLVEQVSLLRPRINRAVCKDCRLCVKACPSQAMADFYAGKRIHADCFACGACIEACPQDDALGWLGPRSE